MRHHIVRHARHIGVVALAAGLGGCFGPTGPIYGQWSGYQPDGALGYERNVRLVLEGTPEARAGTYRMRMTPINPAALLQGASSVYYSDHWTLEAGATNGQAWTRLHLAGLPGTQFDTYDMLPDRTLVPHTPGQPPEAAMPYRLGPLPPTTYGYGRI
ncbi:hypothetical protein HLH34_17230 [Gluconacetobacter azotocaptans]|uniref:Lipoprotein n=1 Tax=Gluconacetobacter azotocaptans TaxID=142834 RepID=A0A7W4JVJ7_9PROT|nr:hypothetical protein [Gluconacetobacter azotocaptans]MBB2191679.1 hypothetical protein [Gluconacetobacter azotocaptans]MBM9403646.1 hypothetical protein [Gluconacetobacter azotocaptans]GBQ33533.1 hypothetical protein AA13594_2649 [Gluconacetobacter azotocaptans DSM 13594]